MESSCSGQRDAEEGGLGLFLGADRDARDKGAAHLPAGKELHMEQGGELMHRDLMYLKTVTCERKRKQGER